MNFGRLEFSARSAPRHEKTEESASHHVFSVSRASNCNTETIWNSSKYSLDLLTPQPSNTRTLKIELFAKYPCQSHMTLRSSIVLASTSKKNLPSIPRKSQNHWPNEPGTWINIGRDTNFGRLWFSARRAPRHKTTEESASHHVFFSIAST